MIFCKKLLLVLVIILSALFPAALPVIAQGVQGAATLGVARVVETKEKNVKDGSLMSTAPDGAKLTDVAYDSQILGVVARDAAILIDTNSGEQSVPIISTGKVYVLVSTKEGVIKKGELITSSTTKGVAVKATKSGYVLGTALEDATNPDPNQIEKIAVDVDLHYFNSKPTLSGTLTDILKLALLPSKEATSPIFKYLVAAGVVLGSIVFGFLSFSRTAAKGVEALGRNPAASKIIHLGIIFNIVIVIAIILAGLAVAFLILRL
jgi:hypothetical protein